ncbi:uncharacterized protein LOC106673446 [Cimex lectularius]|uniref:Uncharacterized protein n=1 Tax=Cimex lectularius TaxID=79782 RepID=A0A8I6SKL2_CIMLE|nr:uncharacterized protein LOC106673446 [Cimex lectularius]
MDLTSIRYNLNCSWEVPDKCQLKDVITFGDADDPLERSRYEDEIEHTINEEQFLKLSKSDGNENCMLSITLEDPCLKIVKLSIVCEARMVELYGKFGEYVGTEICTLLDSSLNISFYNVQPNIYPSKEVSIKFLGIKNSVWIYGVKLLLRYEQPTQPSFFDFNNVEEILKCSKIPISDKAERAKRFLQHFTNGLTNRTKIDHQVLIKMLEDNYLNQFTTVGEMGKNMTKYFSNLMPGSTDDNGDNNKSLNELKLYVDKSIQQLEERVYQTINQQFKDFETKQNKKLDTIIQLLQKS